MPDNSMKVAGNNLHGLLKKAAYISHKQASDALLAAAESLPSSFGQKLRTYINPVGAIKAHGLRRLIRRYEKLRQKHNKQFVDKEIVRHKQLFDDIGGYPLDKQQRRAVVADEDNSLVIAGAGSGKTLTIVGKVKYLLEAMQVEPQTILPISFTAKSAASLKERIGVRGVEPQTFHAFGLRVLRRTEGRQPDIFQGDQNGKLFHDFIARLAGNPKYLASLNMFFTQYLRIPRSQFEFQTRGDYIQYLKDQNFVTYRRRRYYANSREIYRNEQVKSIEECILANFLAFNRIDYEYEQPYAHPYGQHGDVRTYKPDFTVRTPHGSIYIEHLGIDRDGNVPPFFAKRNETPQQASRRYRKLLEWKRQTHTKNGTTLIETYSYQFTEGTFIKDLSQALTEAGVRLQPMTDAEIWHLIQQSGKDQVDAFVSLVETFLALLKSNGHTVRDVRRFNQESDASDFLKQRAALFLNLFEPILTLYERNLEARGQIDFHDMITRAAGYIEDGDYHCPYQYVIVDEFQDLSFGRYRILQAIRDQNPAVKFYCVGDDWQSIYRFTGSDMALFRDFPDFFGHTAISRIETTYRFNQPMIGLSSDFILRNPNQTPKSLKAPRGSEPTTYGVIESDDGDDDSQAVVDAIAQLVKNCLTPDSSVYVIGRYNFDIKRLQNQSQQFDINLADGLIRYTFPDGQFQGQTLDMQYITAHRSKGLEADYAILINCNTGKYGFPSGQTDDPILSLLLSSADQFEHGEERRLFYVAMTRAKRHVVFVTDRYRKSAFIRELQERQAGLPASEQLCPECQGGELILRSGTTADGRAYEFYGCSNFAFGCTYTETLKS